MNLKKIKIFLINKKYLMINKNKNFKKIKSKINI